ncbi:hypothetical protein CANCADRAFT_58443 [Tortispora caseinolytica NRRL Y-17796]|uniref:Xaa-Pro aminopeptidase P n=1 Tax=Tortispora caseinolytica NRRL Y-17796 TaxID=767744 RepID=A0A1E4TD11_9ASCO|nr:hypothetical protein CANCADRAFT_58443 [Tortispora caseinolytica NRRL Y-17796]
MKFTTVDTSERLAQLRAEMSAHGIHLYIVPSEDSHQSEYTAPCDKRREYISGFTGSAGIALITHSEAALSTDGRYFNQASQQLDSNWTLLKQGMKDVPTPHGWIISHTRWGDKVGVDPQVMSTSQFNSLKDKLSRSSGAELIPLFLNLVDMVWPDRPSRPANPVNFHSLKYSGVSAHEKIARLCKFIDDKHAKFIVLTALDEIAWLFNLRGSDIPYNPVFFSYAIVSSDSVLLFVDKSRIDPETTNYISEFATIRPYQSFFDDLRIFAESWVCNVSASTEKPPIVASNKTHPPCLLPENVPYAVTMTVGQNNVNFVPSPVQKFKCVKNSTELAGMIACQERDGAAVIEYLAWLEDQMVSGADIDEVQGADILESCRAKKDLFVGLSFDTISSSGPNSAVIHYSPIRGNCRQLSTAEIYLLDSGGQYLDGTTDTTRTVHFGVPTREEKTCYTLVLKGHISLATAVFPMGTGGGTLDILARRPLWENGLDYRHGTGHGVGSYLNVHEGPMGISSAATSSGRVPLEPGMVISNEPGFYKDGEFGIRIESVVVVCKADTPFSFGDKPFYGFKTITAVPFMRRLIDLDLLDDDEIHWIDMYHQLVRTKVLPFLDGNDLALAWLERETAPLR